MKRTSLLVACSLCVAAGLLAGKAAQAQQETTVEVHTNAPKNGGGQRGNAPRPNIQVFGGPGGAAQMFGGLGNSLFDPKRKDPLKSNLIGLLKRSDVYSELKVASSQRIAVEALEAKMKGELPQRITQAVRETLPDFRAMRELSPNERAEKMKGMRDQIQEKTSSVTQTFYGDIEKELATILSKSQFKRLKEIDLQWRGPLAIGDKIITDFLELNTDQQAEVKKILAEYRQKQAELSSSVMRELFNRNRNGNGSQNGAIPQAGNTETKASGDGVVIIQREVTVQNGQGNRNPRSGARPPMNLMLPDPKEIEAAQESIQKEMDKFLKPLEKRMLAILAEDQTQAWRNVQGRKFTFFTNI